MHTSLTDKAELMSYQFYSTNYPTLVSQFKILLLHGEPFEKIACHIRNEIIDGEESAMIVTLVSYLNKQVNN